MPPGVVRDVGDIPQLAAIIAPRKPLTGAELKAAYEPATRVWQLLKAERELGLLDSTNAMAIVQSLK